MPSNLADKVDNDQPGISGVKATAACTKRKKKSKQLDYRDSDSDSNAGSIEPDSSQEDEHDEMDEDSVAQKQDKFQSGEWVVVAYPGKKKNTLNYIGKIEKVLNKESQVEVRFVRKQSGGTMFKFPDIEDIDTIPYSCIVERLSQPEMNNREQYIFKKLKSHVLT